MGKILDKLEFIVRRWYWLFCLMLVALMTVALFACTYQVQRTVYDIPNGACYCPSCGTVMVIEGKAVEK